MFVLVVSAMGSASAAELRVRTQCQASGPVVTLGDVAEVFSADAQQAARLAAIELFPAPGGSRQRFVPVRELQDLLLLRGVNLTEHHFSGSNQVAVAGQQAAERSEGPLPPSAQQRAERRIREALVQYLQQILPQDDGSAEAPCTVQFQLGPEQERLAASPAHRLAISGGGPPWTGSQRFEVAVDTADGPAGFALDAEVSAAPAMVVAVRALPRGAVLRAGDVALRPELPRDPDVKSFYAIEDVIGKETTQAIAQGKMLETKMLRAPLLVQRREVVTVYARSAGVCVKTVGRAEEDGSMGDLVAVESMYDRKTYFARVIGVREVEVFAHAVQVTPPSSVPPLTVVAGGGLEARPNRGLPPTAIDRRRHERNLP